MLVSWADGAVNESNELSLTPPDYGVYLYDESQARNNQLIVNDEKSLGAVRAPDRRAPRAAHHPVASKTSRTPSTPTTFGSIDVRETSLSRAPRRHRVAARSSRAARPRTKRSRRLTRVRIIEGFSTEGSPNHTMFGLTMAEGAAILGEAKVEADGSWLANIPPYVPVHLQPIDEFDLVDPQPNHLDSGHAGRKSRVRRLPRGSQQGQLAECGQERSRSPRGRGPENFMKPVDSRTEYPWAYANDAGNPNEIQALLNAKCVSCHNGTTNGDKPQEFYTRRP